MDMNALSTAALGLVSPWQATDIQFDAQRRRLDIRVDFKPGSSFGCPASLSTTSVMRGRLSPERPR